MPRVSESPCGRLNRLICFPDLSGLVGEMSIFFRECLDREAEQGFLGDLIFMRRKGNYLVPQVFVLKNSGRGRFRVAFWGHWKDTSRGKKTHSRQK